jgi:predicted ribosomally synthesized peptide with SipW-like signal peptide
MTCNDIYHQLDAFVDGETSPEQTRLIEERLASCPTCQARVDQLRALSRAVKDDLLNDRAPSALWAKIETHLPPDAESSTLIHSSAWWRDHVRPLALAASVALLLGIGGSVAWWQSQANDAVIAAPVQDFNTYRLSGRDLDVESRNPAVIEAWFEERLAFELPRIEARVAGFDLVGGRLCGFLDRRISALAYERGDQKIAVYVMADHDLALPDATFAPELKLSRSVHELDDVNSMIWHENGLVYAVVSDLKKDDLSIFLAALARGDRQRAGA